LVERPLLAMFSDRYQRSSLHDCYAASCGWASHSLCRPTLHYEVPQSSGAGTDSDDADGKLSK